MSFNIGDFVTRSSHNNDIIFKIVSIEDDIAIIKGVNVRLCADSKVSDLQKVSDDMINTDDRDFLRKSDEFAKLNRESFFYLPGKVLHIDADEEYLARCMKFYEKMKVKALGFVIDEDEMYSNLDKYLVELNPNIVVITGHDAYFKNKGNKTDLNNYKNSHNFIKAINVARNYERNQEKLIIIAGACQSDYEELIKAGANFASSPKRVNIHALDPAIVASSVALADANKPIDLIEILKKTSFGIEGMGGIVTNGTMYMGYPR